VINLRGGAMAIVATICAQPGNQSMLPSPRAMKTRPSIIPAAPSSENVGKRKSAGRESVQQQG
jgi:hypothetical protein